MKYIKWYEWIIRPRFSYKFYRILKEHSEYCDKRIEQSRQARENGINFKDYRKFREEGKSDDVAYLEARAIRALQKI